MHPILNIAVTAARRAGDIIMRAYDRPDKLTVIEKRPNDFVTEIDRLAEKDIIGTIQRTYPSHSILGEESGNMQGDEHVWIIDPIDGTTNFIHGFPHFCVSIAFAYRGIIEHAVIYDPIRQDLFTASKGMGAKLNNYRIRVNPKTTLEQALVAFGFAAKHKESIGFYLDILNTLFPKCSGMRRAGSAALDLAYVAAGRLDGFFEYGLERWDIAAGALLVKEAGGLIADFSGKENYLENGNVIAGNAKIFKELLQTIQPKQAALL